MLLKIAVVLLVIVLAGYGGISLYEDHVKEGNLDSYELEEKIFFDEDGEIRRGDKKEYFKDHLKKILKVNDG